MPKIIEKTSKNGVITTFSDGLGGIFGEKKIIAPDELKKMKNVIVLICSAQPRVINEIENKLDGMIIEHYVADEFIFKMHASEILECYDGLFDDESKKVFFKLIETRMCRNEQKGYIENKIISDNQYFEWNKFTSFINLGRFVDCGSYVGDSIEKYIWYMDGVFDKIIAIEPDTRNFNRLEKRVARLKDEWIIDDNMIELYAKGVGERNTSCKFESYDNNNGLGSKFIDNPDADGASCEIVSLDSFIDEPYSFLKADIEGYEYKMLLGAESGIKKYKPALAICIYHNAVDMYSIPLLIKSFVPEYKMAIRHYSGTWAETVLYCWIEN
jgi:FkbM family methyltransferase